MDVLRDSNNHQSDSLVEDTYETVPGEGTSHSKTPVVSDDKKRKTTRRKKKKGGLKFTGKRFNASMVAMYAYWKNIHEVSGKIVENLEEFAKHLEKR